MERNYLGVTPPLPELGTWPLKDTVGMTAFVLILQKSLEGGQKGGTVKFNTVRKLRTAFATVYLASYLGQPDYSSISHRN